MMVSKKQFRSLITILFALIILIFIGQTETALSQTPEKTGIARSLPAEVLDASSCDQNNICTVSSTSGWLTTSLTLNQGQVYTVNYLDGTWTVDYKWYSWVGPEGYNPSIDYQISYWDLCKTLKNSPYATLLGRVGNGDTFPIARGGNFSAPISGNLYLRINDNDNCQVDNQGSVRVSVSSQTASRLELTGLEVTQAIQNLKNDVFLVKDKATYVRAHVRSTSGAFSNVSAELIGTRNGSPLPSSPLKPANSRGMINVINVPDRLQLDDSFYFILPEAWRNGTVELEFRGVNQSFVCLDHTGTSNDCKTTITFKDIPPLEIKFFGAQWHESNGTVHVPSYADISKVADLIKASYPISNLKWSYDSYFDLILDNFVQDPMTLNIRLAEQRVLDGCINVFDLGCQTIYVGVIVDPVSGTTLLGLGGFPANVASGFWIPGKLEMTLPHEIAHSLGRLHTPACNASTMPFWNYPYPNGYISPMNSGDSAFYGFNTYSKTVIAPTTGDLMTYCFPFWPSDWTYKGLSDEISKRFKALSSMTDPAQPGSTRAIMISGQVAASGNSGTIDSLYRFTSSTSLPQSTTGTYELRLENSNGNLLFSYPFEPASGMQCPPNCDVDNTLNPFVVAVPEFSQVDRVVLLHGTHILAIKEASATPPGVKVIFPNGGETLSASSAWITWTSTDTDGDNLKYALQYSNDDGVTWQTLATGITTTSFEIQPNNMPGTSQGLVRVIASDGFHTSQDESDAYFSIPIHVSEVMIKEPVGGQIYATNQTIFLSGSAYDVDEGKIDGANLAWYLDYWTLLGTGENLEISANTLSAGQHSIDLRATSKDGQTNTDAYSFTVVSDRQEMLQVLSVQPPQLIFNGHIKRQRTINQNISVRNGGDGVLNWSLEANQPWIKASIVSGSAPADIQVYADLTGLPIGDYEGTITLSSIYAQNSPVMIQVKLTVRTGYTTFFPLVQR